MAFHKTTPAQRRMYRFFFKKINGKAVLHRQNRTNPRLGEKAKHERVRSAATFPWEYKKFYVLNQNGDVVVTNTF